MIPSRTVEPTPPHEYVIGVDPLELEAPERPLTARWAVLYLLAGLVGWVILGLAFIGLLAVIGWGPTK